MSILVLENFIRCPKTSFPCATLVWLEYRACRIKCTPERERQCVRETCTCVVRGLWPRKVSKNTVGNRRQSTITYRDQYRLRKKTAYVSDASRTTRLLVRTRHVSTHVLCVRIITSWVSSAREFALLSYSIRF